MDGIVIGIVVVIFVIVLCVVLLYKKKTYVKLDDKQFLTDVFDVECAKNWYREKCNNNTQGKKLFLAYLNKDIQKKLKISYTGMDPEHYLIIALLKNNEIIDYQFVNFGCVEPKFRQLLDKNGGKLVIED